tara:strand:- start:1281 stop:2129 length:849 start_codon:yes stop_codon:yes gene_type:complete
MQNILDKLGYHEKWHLSNSSRKRCMYSINEPIIDHILEKLNIDDGFFVEFGAWDGINLSNCRKLYEIGWRGMYIEADINKFIELNKNYENNNKIITVNSFVDENENTLDKILKEHNINHVDFCSIDIDGLDLNVFNAIKKIYPTIICIEGGQVLFPTDRNKVSVDIQKDNVTQSLYNYMWDFQKKKYRLLCAYQDIFFVKEEYYNLFNVSNNIYEIYINGLFALPRIPWLYEKKEQYNIKNDILDYIISNTNNKNIRNRKLWVIDNENKLSEIELYLRNKYC